VILNRRTLLTSFSLVLPAAAAQAAASKKKPHLTKLASHHRPAVKSVSAKTHHLTRPHVSPQS
jgi:hypothetical protein